MFSTTNIMADKNYMKIMSCCICTLTCVTVCYPYKCVKQFKYSNCTVSLEEHQACLSAPYVITNMHNPVQNLGQTWVFYKADQTQLTKAKWIGGMEQNTGMTQVTEIFDKYHAVLL